MCDIFNNNYKNKLRLMYQFIFYKCCEFLLIFYWILLNFVKNFFFEQKDGLDDNKRLNV